MVYEHIYEYVLGGEIERDRERGERGREGGREKECVREMMYR